MKSNKEKKMVVYMNMIKSTQSQETLRSGINFVNGKATIQLESNVEFWVNSSTTDFTQYLIRPRIK